MQGGEHWIIDVSGIEAQRLEGDLGRELLEGLFADLVGALELHPLAPVWSHTFGAVHGSGASPGGTTALLPLSESHLSAHGFPEAGSLSLDLYTCRARPAPDWSALVRARFGPCDVDVRRLERGPHGLAAADRPAGGEWDGGRV